MNFSVLPPEINSALMFSGAGSAPMLAAAGAWDGLAAELDSAAQAFSSVASDLTAQAWQGPASQAMTAAAAPYASWLNAASAHASQSSAQAQAVAGAFESALAATVHPATVAANRSGLVSLVVSNLFGQNAPAIAATEWHYEEMWAQDVMAMVGYHGGASAAAAQLEAAPAASLGSLQNLGYANFGYDNIGVGNYGGGNVGLFNAGNVNFGIGNHGHNNIGVGNYGVGNVGLFNAGDFNFGIGNSGYYNLGIGLTGTGQVGIGGGGLLNPFRYFPYYGGYPYYY